MEKYTDLQQAFRDPALAVITEEIRTPDSLTRRLKSFMKKSLALS